MKKEISKKFNSITEGTGTSAAGVSFFIKNNKIF